MHRLSHLGCVISYSLLAVDRLKSEFRVQDNLAGGVELAALDRAEFPHCGQESVKVVTEQWLVLSEKLNLVWQEEALVVA